MLEHEFKMEEPSAWDSSAERKNEWDPVEWDDMNETQKIM